jgi:two-component system sensor histidine kinase PilS (NtrC family)
VEPSSLTNKLRLLTLFRLVVAIVFLLATFIGLRDEVEFFSTGGRELVYGAITGLLLLCVVTAALLERISSPPQLLLLAYVHFFGDALFATALVALTGGVESVFTFLYSLAIINASIVLYRKGAVFLAVVNTLLLAAVAGGQTGLLGANFQSLLGDGTVLWHREAARSLVAVLPSLTVNALAFFGIAFLSSYLAEQLRSADVLAREQEADLQQLTNLHETILSSLENGLITVDHRRSVAFINQRACQLLQRSEVELLGRQVSDIFPDMGPVLENPDKAQRSHTETTIQMIGGRRTYLRWTISPLRDRDGRQIGYILLFFDITRMKEMELEVERAERLAALGRMAANIAHEIRNPLASMSGSIQLLADSLDVAGAERRLMDIVVRETEHLNQWISEFLDFARPRESLREAVDVADLAEEVVSMLRHDERCAQVTLHYSRSGDGTVMGDRSRLRQVVWNLAVNAVEAASGEKGTVAVAVLGRDDHVILRVEDNGPGLTDDQVSRIFEPFFTTKAKGTGLGLATVYRNIEEHNGTIDVIPTEGTSGATFVVVLPRVPSRGTDDLDDAVQH